MNLATQDSLSPGDTSLSLVLLCTNLAKINLLPQLTFTYSKSTMQTLEQYLKGTIKVPEQLYGHHSRIFILDLTHCCGVFIAGFEQVHTEWDHGSNHVDLNGIPQAFEQQNQNRR